MSQKLNHIRITECPRDAWQGLPLYIPVQDKARYINGLLKLGFHTIDLGSYVNPLIVPQMKDTEELLSLIDHPQHGTDLMVLVVSKRGAVRATDSEKISLISFPFSLSETFLKKNISMDFSSAFSTALTLSEIANNKKKRLRVYLAMAFGNPYKDSWSPDLLYKWIERFMKEGITNLSLTDILGQAQPDVIGSIFKEIFVRYPKLDISLHLHVKTTDWKSKIEAAYSFGCRSFDSVLGGVGGCPMTGLDLVANLETRNLLRFAQEKSIHSKISLKDCELFCEQNSNIFMDNGFH